MNELGERTERIIANNKYLILATASSGGKPWSTPVFYAADDNHNFYWYSRKEARHSQNIVSNNTISACILSVGNQDEGFGVYIEGVASEVTESELPFVMEVYAKKAAVNEEEYNHLTTKKDFLGESQLRMYKLELMKIYVSNESTKWNGKWIDTRSEVKL